MATITPSDLRNAQQAGGRARIASALQRQGALIALALLVLFGVLRYGDTPGSACHPLSSPWRCCWRPAGWG